MIRRSLDTLPHSLRVRTTSWSVCVLTVALTVFSIGMYVEVHRFLVESLHRSLDGIAQTIAHYDVSQVSVKGDAWMAAVLQETYSDERSDRFVRVSSGAEVLFHTNDMREPYIKVSDIPLPRSAESGIREERVDGQKIVISTLLVPSTGGRVYRIEAGASPHRMEQALRSLTWFLAIATTVIVFFASIGGYVLMKRSLHPLAVLTENAANIGYRHLGHRLPVVSTGDELELLALSLNGMIDRLEDSLNHNRRFSADASHELRTPLAIMQGELEDIIQFDNLPTDSVVRLESALEEINRMSRIVNSLMAIARLDDGGEQLDLQTLDLAALVRATVEQMQFIAEEKGITLTCDCDRRLTIQGDPMRIKQVIVNLVDNAIKYSPSKVIHEMPDAEAREDGSHGSSEGSPRISVSAVAAGTLVELKVADQGIGIAAAALPYVFDRFYRTDSARSRGAGGVGLGLAIAKAIVTAHEGSISIKSVVNHGTEVTVQLPLGMGQATTALIEPTRMRTSAEYHRI